MNTSHQVKLSSAEVAYLWMNFMGDSMVLSHILGKHRDPDVRDYMKRGMEISKKHIELFETALKSHNLPSPTTWANEVTDSIQPVFSDSLMMYHVGLLNGDGLGNYGLALSHSIRQDIAVLFTRLMAEIGQYSEEGVNLQIKHEWLEKPPMVPEREELISRDN